MFIILGDDNSDRHIRPLVNYVFIAINVAVFFLLQGAGNDYRFTYAFSTVPQEIISGTDIVTQASIVTDPDTGTKMQIPGLEPTPFSVYLTLLTSMFMHGGLMHLFGNMLYLFIFGDNIENRIGHRRYLMFYLICGLLASLAHVFTTVALGDNLMIPSLGASGAISGVLGGYLLLFPQRRVRMMVFYRIVQVPAMIAIGVWFLFQIISSIGMLSGQAGGVAYGAHIGGFIAGLVLIKFFDLTAAPIR